MDPNSPLNARINETEVDGPNSEAQNSTTEDDSNTNHTDVE